MSDLNNVPSIPRHVRAGIASGVVALVLFVVMVLYYIVIGSGEMEEPPRGLFPIWAMSIAVLALVPVSLWAANCAARPNRQEIIALRMEVRQALERFGDSALQATREAGELSGIVSELRNNPPSQAESATVLSIVDGRRGGHAN